MTKIRKNIMLPEILDEEVRKLSEEKGVSQSSIISNAISYYIEHNGVDHPKLGRVLDLLFKENFKELIEEQRTTRIAVNSMAKQSHAYMQFWNDYYLNVGNGKLLTTDVKMSAELKQAEKFVQNRILKAQQKKYS